MIKPIEQSVSTIFDMWILIFDCCHNHTMLLATGDDEDELVKYMRADMKIFPARTEDDYLLYKRYG